MATNAERGNPGRLLTLAALATGIMSTPLHASPETPAGALPRPTASSQKPASRLEAIEDVRRLQRAWGYYMDRGDWIAVAALFSAKGEYSIGASGTFIGPDRIAAWLRHVNHGADGLRQGQLNETLVLQPVIGVADDGMTATARWRVLGMAGEYGKSASWHEDRLDAAYVREGGVWKIARLKVSERMAVPYQGGWGANPLDALATTGDPAFPADRAGAVDVAGGVGLPPPMLIEAARDEIDVLARRLAAAVDVENLVGALGYHTDERDWGGVASLFTDDALLLYGPRGGYRGRAHIRTLLDQFGPQRLQPGEVANRMQVQPVIHVAADGARAWARTRSIMQLNRGGKTLFGDSVNEFELRLTPAGWRVASMKVWPTFLSDLGRGIIGGILPPPKPDAVLPPDLPADMPGDDPIAAWLPPFHFRHPVTGAPIGAAWHGDGATAEVAGWDSGGAPQPLAELADLRALENLQRTYGFLVDKALWRDTADLFTDDGRLEIGGRGVFVGRDRIAHYYRFLGPEGPLAGRIINHLQLQPVFTIAPDGLHAKGRARFLAVGGDRRDKEQRAADSVGVPATSPSYLGIGIYENDYRKEGGVWKIANLKAYFRMYTFDQDGWAKRALPLTKPEPTLPPDLQPTEQYGIYPETFIAPVHFDHPVTGATPGK